MFKIFINEIPIFFTENNNDLTEFSSVEYQDFSLKKILLIIKDNPSAKINVICDNLENDWKNFLLNFEIRKAAGGIVKNSKDEVLWIYRFDKWDLPKGHIEKDESKEIAAVREVEEECNVSGLIIDKELQTTYHVFEHKGILVMKITYWFLMHTKVEQFDLIPQIEEGITKVCFKNKNESLNCLSNTYKNIELLLEDIL